MSWSLKSYGLLVNQNGNAVKLLRGTWRHPEKMVLLGAPAFSAEERTKIMQEAMTHVHANIFELEQSLLSRLKEKKCASGYDIAARS